VRGDKRGSPTHAPSPRWKHNGYVGIVDASFGTAGREQPIASPMTGTM
jgi:hypothetical protein